MTRRALLLLVLALLPLAILLVLRPRVVPANYEASPATATFAEGFLDHLETVRAAADALVDLGERRERNLLVVSQRQAAMTAALDATDAWLREQIAHQNDPAVTAYHAGADDIRRAMADAQSAFLRFDWESIALANDTLKQGAAHVSTAEDLLLAASRA